MTQSPSECRLMLANGTSGVVCLDKDCPFWRSQDRLEFLESRPGCAIQYFNLLDGGPELSAWLLDVRTRLETEPGLRNVGQAEEV